MLAEQIFICLGIREFANFLQTFLIDQFQILIYLSKYDFEISNLKKTHPNIHTAPIYVTFSLRDGGFLVLILLRSSNIMLSFERLKNSI